MAITVLLAGAPQGHVLQDGDIVLDDGGLTHHYAGGVIEHDAAADAGCGMHIHAEHSYNFV